MGFFGGSEASTGGGGGVGPAGRKTDGTYGTAYDAERASRRNEFRNQGAKNIEELKLPGAAGTILGIFKEPFKKGSKITRGFFEDKVLDAGRFKYEGEVINTEKFNKLSSSQQEKVYKSYLDDRLTNTTDAYGNPLVGGGSRDNGGINMAGTQAKAAQKKAVDAAPDGPTNIEMTATDGDLTAAQKKLKANREGRKITILNDQEEELTLGKKVLLG